MMRYAYHIFFTVILTFSIIGCSNESAPTPPVGSKLAPETRTIPTLEQRLFNDIDQRRTWPVSGVKIWLANPTVSARLSMPDNTPVLVHAWGSNENDFNVAMMRLDEGETLYAITEKEFWKLYSLNSESPTLTRKDELDKHVGQLVTVRGEVANSKIPSIIGVDIQSNNPDLRGQIAEATGILLRHVVSPEDIANIDFAHRGAGVFYRLLDIDSDYEAPVRPISSDE